MARVPRAIRVLAAAGLWALLALGCSQSTVQTGGFPLQQPPNGPPGAAGPQAVVLSSSAAGDGATTHVSVASGSNLGTLSVGLAPVFLGKANGVPFVINGATLGFTGPSNTVSLYSQLSPQYGPAQQSTLTTIDLPGSVSGAAAGALANNGNLYLADSGSNDVSMINTSLKAVTSVVPVGARPVAVVAGPALGKVYVINHDDNTVTVISTIDNTVKGTLFVGAQPVWGVMTADGSHVYVVNQGDATVSVIATATDTVIATLAVGSSAPSAGPQPNYAVFESTRQRVYVSNTGSNMLSVLQDGATPTKVADVPLSGAAVSVAALADGSKIYAALGGCPAGTNHTNLLANLSTCVGSQVSVIDAGTLVESKTVAVGRGAVWLDASADSTRLFAADGDGTIGIVNTSTDTASMLQVSASQVPFMVRVFP